MKRKQGSLDSEQEPKKKQKKVIKHYPYVDEFKENGIVQEIVKTTKEDTSEEMEEVSKLEDNVIGSDESDTEIHQHEEINGEIQEELEDENEGENEEVENEEEENEDGEQGEQELEDQEEIEEEEEEVGEEEEIEEEDEEEEEWKQWINCRKCSKIYEDARVLPCGHSFCFKCIKKSPKECDTCATKFHKDISQLPSNVAINNLLSLIPHSSTKQLKICGDCGESEATCYCEDCMLLLCLDCSLSIHSSKNQKKHLINHLSNSGNHNIVFQRCTPHGGEEKKMFCEKCDIFLCIRCADDHRSHNPMSVYRLSDTIKEKWKSRIEKTISKTDQYVNSIDTHSQDEIDEIEKEIQKLEERLMILKDKKLKKQMALSKHSLLITQYNATNSFLREFVDQVSTNLILANIIIRSQHSNVQKESSEGMINEFFEEDNLQKIYKLIFPKKTVKKTTKKTTQKTNAKKKSPSPRNRKRKSEEKNTTNNNNNNNLKKSNKKNEDIEEEKEEEEEEIKVVPKAKNRAGAKKETEKASNNIVNTRKSSIERKETKSMYSKEEIEERNASFTDQSEAKNAIVTSFSTRSFSPHNRSDICKSSFVVVHSHLDMIAVVEDHAHNVQIYDLRGKLRFLIGNIHDGQKFSFPSGIAMNRNANLIAVADKCNHQIQVFNLGGEFEFKFGKKGKEKGQFSYPKAIDISYSEMTIAVTDSKNNRVQLFDLTGKFVSLFDCSFQPLCISICSRKKLIYLTSSDDHLIRAYDFSGHLKMEFGGFGFEDGKFNNPQGISVNYKKNMIAVADSQNDRIQFFDLAGKFRYKFGSGRRSASTHFTNPMGISIDPNQDIVAISAIGNHKVTILRTPIIEK